MDRLVLPEIPGAVWRPLVPDDAEAMANLHNACHEVDHTFRMTPGEMRDEFDRFGENAHADSIGAFTGDGELVALGWGLVPPSGTTENRAFVWLLVRPSIRGSVEDALLDWIEDATVERLRSFADGLPMAMYRFDVYEWMMDEADLFQRHGFVPSRYFTENVRDLAEPIEAAPLSDDLEARPWSDEAVGDSLAVHNAAFVDHWGSQPIEREHWDTFYTNEFFQPQMSWVVYDGDTPVAYMQCSKYPHDWEDRGRTEAWIDGIGTIRSHRGRGVASALITMAMRSFRDDALEFAVLGVDSENPTGANRIYERLGFIPEKRMVAFRKQAD
jgi:mycothiol synthase